VALAEVTAIAALIEQVHRAVRLGHLNDALWLSDELLKRAEKLQLFLDRAGAL